MSSAPSPANAPGLAPGEEDWRTSVAQSFRNTQVREIAAVLASLEPGASSSSKLMLAMRFEDNIFKTSSSLADYQKKLAKRLKKVQKSFVPSNQAATPSNNKEALLLELRQKYGDALRYVHKHAKKAVSELQVRHGSEKARQLQQHTDMALQWAMDLGLLEHSKVNHRLDEAHLLKLKGHLEKRMENIRSHVVKLADPDRFLKETLERKQTDMSPQASKIMAINIKKRFEQLQGGKPFDADKVLQETLEKAQVLVPPPSRAQRDEEKAALKHLEKMRAVSSAIIAAMAIPDKANVPKNSLVKCHTVATESAQFVVSAMKHRKTDGVQDSVSLADAWTKTLEQPQPEVSLDEEPQAKRIKLSPVLKSRVLLTPGRKTPSNLLPAFKRKRAILVRPPPNGEGTHLVLHFGKAFVMRIYLVPLVVAIRAFRKQDEDEVDPTARQTWTSLHEGLAEKDNLKVWGVTGPYDTLGHVVEERLRDASSHATKVLRKCFASSVKDTAAEFEVELLEATALLEFLQLVRKTYIPNWQDEEV